MRFIEKPGAHWLLALLVPTIVALALSGCSKSEDPCRAVLGDPSSTVVWPSTGSEPRIAHVGFLRDAAACHNAEASQGLKLAYPKAMAADSRGKVYVSDRFGVRVFETTTGLITKFAEEASNARGIAIASGGNVYIADSARRQVLVYRSTGELLKAIGAEGDFVNPQGIAIDKARDRFYVADTGTSTVRAYSLEGQHLFTIGSTEGQLVTVPTQVAVSSTGEVFVLHQGRHKVLVYGADGGFLRKFGPTGTMSGMLWRPKGIAIDSEDHVYVTDAAFDNYQIFDTHGQLLLWVGKAGAGAGGFNLPFMISIDDRDRIFVAEYGNHRVQVFQYLGRKYQARKR